ncbi:LytTR family DNA-binding domain-containing protein [Lysinibacillus sp. OL1_EC]|uniref:LytR/AlgR family response regulator transcription factor n=1 Tax=Lysinibacillus TaxID=400634 RepID=UPI00103B928D|nr:MULTISPECIES: LytTR family DNA-binding domain-containing protein [Lysinibacillus]MBX8942730.1 response regulator transcription factor [Lysinibacillus sp. K60]MCM0626356.1 LytTR family DNA-binding domain-containing protein [Lysinibacillus sp. OL1_EC]TBV88126.1 response regulator transcription factor [Lysinibacillus sp. OL1]UKJ46023.1 LytTR family DNA-binding domain-containing protein [Lysinibacillus sp. ACHW1.5]WGT40547.1 LytTR family DNA-binding domain-containing protein [Lysinibacillus sp.
MRVIICEDDYSQRQFIQNEIKTYASFHLPSIEIALIASNAEDVVNYTSHTQGDCYFLDIELEGDMNGLELARLIREKNPLANIIFITAFANKLKLTFKYKIAAMDYIVKSIDKAILSKNITEALDTAYKRYLSLGKTQTANIIQIKIGDSIKNIKFEDIYYFETASVAHKIKLHTKNGIYEFYGKLKELEKLDSRFCRCHNSYLINIEYVKEFTPKSGSLLMNNGHECLVSYRYSKNIKRNTHIRVL